VSLWSAAPACDRHEHAQIAVLSWYPVGGLFLVVSGGGAIVGAFLEQPGVYVPAFSLFASAVCIWCVQAMRLVGSRSTSGIDRIVAGWPAELLCVAVSTAGVSAFFL
jgi:hypothetical protein